MYTKTLECHVQERRQLGCWDKLGTVKEPGRSSDWWNHRGGFNYSAIFNQYINQGYINLSDKRIKTNISELNDVECLNIVNKINTYKYDYINKENTNKNTYGFIAQDVLNICQMVHMVTLDIYKPEKHCQSTWESIDIGITKWKVLDTALEFVKLLQKMQILCK